MTVIVIWHFPTVPMVGLQCMIVVFPDQTRSFLKSHPECEFFQTMARATRLYLIG